MWPLNCLLSSWWIILPFQYSIAFSSPRIQKHTAGFQSRDFYNKGPPDLSEIVCIMICSFFWITMSVPADSSCFTCHSGYGFDKLDLDPRSGPKCLCVLHYWIHEIYLSLTEIFPHINVGQVWKQIRNYVLSFNTEVVRILRVLATFRFVWSILISFFTNLLKPLYKCEDHRRMKRAERWRPAVIGPSCHKMTDFISVRSPPWPHHLNYKVTQKMYFAWLHAEPPRSFYDMANAANPPPHSPSWRSKRRTHAAVN